MKKKFGLTKFCLVWQNLEFRQTDVWQNSANSVRPMSDEYFDSTDVRFHYCHVIMFG